MFSLPLAQLRGSEFKPSRTLPDGYFLFVVFVIAAVLILAWTIWILWRQSSRSKQEWAELTSLLRRAGLSRDEFNLLRRMLRQAKVKKPTEIVRSERAYASFVKKHSQWTGHHTEVTLKSIQRKLFGTSPDSN